MTLDTETRVRVQLQTGNRDVVPSVILHGTNVTWLQVALSVRTIVENACHWGTFTRKRDEQAALKAAMKLVGELERARNGGYRGGDGNQFRSTFTAQEAGKSRQFRIDVEVRGGRLWNDGL